MFKHFPRAKDGGGAVSRLIPKSSSVAVSPAPIHPLNMMALSLFFIRRCRVSKKKKRRSCTKLFKSERKGRGSSSANSGSDSSGHGDISSSHIKRIPVCGWWFSLAFIALLSSQQQLMITFSAASGTPELVQNSTIFVSSSSDTTKTHIETSSTPTPTISPSPLIISSPPPTSTSSSNHRLILILSVSAAAALILLIVMGCLLKFNIIKSKRRSSKRVEDAELPQSSFFPSDLNLNSCNDDDRQKKKIDHHHPSTVRRFSWEEIVKVSRNFSVVIGQGGLSTVYLAELEGPRKGAVKIHQKSERLDTIFKEELRVLLHLQHPNIVQIFGYCDEPQGDEMGGALVFEYVPNGNLQERLHGNGNILMWKDRMWIAFQLARAIEYLHDKCTLPIVHGDIKSSNVLLDDQLNCKLCDFGSAKMGFSATVVPSSSSACTAGRRSLMGSPGYVDPHYLRTGIASKKNDVYSFGVIILELITGMEAFCSEKEQLLTAVAGPLLRREDSDIDLQSLTAAWAKPQDLNRCDSEEVLIMASISAQCLQQQPSLRPSMLDILTTMKNKLSSISPLLLLTTTTTRTTSTNQQSM